MCNYTESSGNGVVIGLVAVIVVVVITALMVITALIIVIITLIRKKYKKSVDNLFNDHANMCFLLRSPSSQLSQADKCTYNIGAGQYEMVAKKQKQSTCTDNAHDTGGEGNQYYGGPDTQPKM